MEQHAVPQHISSYEFRLVGDMTLKQFFQLAGGIVVSLIFYASPLPGFIKWPFILLFALTGVGLAFLPFEERPLSTWFFAFIKAVYSPTQYTWKEDSAEEIFSKSTTPQIPVVVAPQGEKRAQEYLAKVPQTRVLEAFEAGEKNFFGKVASLFQTATSPALFAGPFGEPEPTPPKPPMSIPVVEPVKVEPIHPPMPAAPLQQAVYQPQPVAPVFQPAGRIPLPGAPATFTPEAAPPAASEQPNTVVGQVLTQEGKIVEGAILEIRDSDRRPVRALKTNKVGHFLSVTPLRDGTYEIETEKEGLTFDKVTFTASSLIIPPIQIRAKGGGELAS
ncbi:MAG: PrgI family protein [Candidatus Blackburnbacteria bacterium]|nr:PrgI family protein [Candidatus Blackburnbacteria bacterium]